MPSVDVGDEWNVHFEGLVADTGTQPGHDDPFGKHGQHGSIIGDTNELGT